MFRTVISDDSGTEIAIPLPPKGESPKFSQKGESWRICQETTDHRPTGNEAPKAYNSATSRAFFYLDGPISAPLVNADHRGLIVVFLLLIAAANDVELELHTIGLNSELNHIVQFLVDKVIHRFAISCNLSVVIRVI